MLTNVNKIINILLSLFISSLILNTSVIADSSAFVIAVQTDNNGTSNDNQFTIPTNPDYSYYYDVDCGYDGSFEGVGISDSNYTCSFPTDNNSTPRLIGIIGDFPHFYLNNQGDKEKLINVEQWGTQQWKSMESSFYGAKNLIYIAASPDLSNVTNMNSMFRLTYSFSSANNINEWDVSNVTEMKEMFYNARSFNQNIADWNVSKVTNTSDMFASAYVFNQDIGRWDVSNVETMSNMFRDSYVFNKDIGNWDTSNTYNMRSMFYNSKAFNQDIGDWDISNVRLMYAIFKGAKSFNQDLGDWDITGVTDPIEIEEMFAEHIFGYGANLSVSNYDNLLLSWNKLDPVNYVDFDGGSSNYCRGTGAHDDLEYGSDAWFFSDGGENCDFHITSSYTMSVENGESAVGKVTISSSTPETFFQLGLSVDSNKFIIDSVSGELSFKIPPNANIPTDSNGDNIYRVQVIAYDDNIGEDNDRIDIQTIRVKVERNNTSIAPIISYLLN